MGIVAELYKRLAIFRHKPRHWILRPETIDRRVFRHVVIDNEYNLPERFSPSDIILDVGAHIGSFSYAVLKRGAGTIYSCEPNAANFSLLKNNLAPYSQRVHLLPHAVWRSDQPAGQLHFHNPGDARNTGEGRVSFKATAESVSTIPFDEVIARATEGGRRIKLLKMDCEGAEWPILLTSRKLHLIDAICGEYHLDACPETFSIPNCGNFTCDLLEGHLGREGFQVQTLPMEPRPDLWGWFHAQRAA